MNVACEHGTKKSGLASAVGIVLRKEPLSPIGGMSCSTTSMERNMEIFLENRNHISKWASDVST